MKKTLLTLAAAVSVGIVALGVPRTAQARCVGCAVGAGVLGGACGRRHHRLRGCRATALLRSRTLFWVLWPG